MVNHQLIKQYPQHILLLFHLMFAALANAQEVNIQVKDHQGNPLSDAVIYIESDDKNPNKNIQQAIAQKGKKFNPLVTVIQTGTSINFPNHDRVKHHVYSFSPAKKFELKLYSGVPATPIVFDKAGIAVLGCNIHDNMLAYIYIVDTPYFAKTNQDGMATIMDIPKGQFDLKVWHYAQKDEGVPASQIIKVGEKNEIIILVDVQSNALVH